MFTNVLPHSLTLSLKFRRHARFLSNKNCMPLKFLDILMQKCHIFKATNSVEHHLLPSWFFLNFLADYSCFCQRNATRLSLTLSARTSFLPANFCVAQIEFDTFNSIMPLIWFATHPSFFPSSRGVTLAHKVNFNQWSTLKYLKCTNHSIKETCLADTKIHSGHCG